VAGSRLGGWLVVVSVSVVVGIVWKCQAAAALLAWGVMVRRGCTFLVNSK